MGFFDNFYKKKPDNGERKKFSIKEELENKNKALQEGMLIQNGILKRVYANGVINGTFIVPKNVTSIGLYAFSRLENLQKIVMHENIEFIGQGAFQDCKNLTQVTGLENATKLNSVSGFAGCTNLKKITLPHSIENVGFEAFLDCHNLAEINLPEGCWCISSSAFAGCENLQIVRIPAGVEMIEEEAFAGCKSATIVFLEDDKKLVDDFAYEQKAINAELYGDEYENESEDFMQDSDEQEEKEPLTLEERIQMYEDFNIRYRIINIADEKFFWPSKPLQIKANAFAGVKELLSITESKLQAAIQSGYNGNVTLAYPDTNTTLRVDLKTLEYIEQAKKSSDREKFYSMFLIPPDGTLNWLLNCEANHYHGNGYSGSIVWQEQVASDATISIEDFKQPKSNLYKYTLEEDEFFTSVTFRKKEYLSSHIHDSKEYERQYSVYYPYGARFDTELLTQIGAALSALMDTARDLADNDKNKDQLNLIENKQKALIKLLTHGTCEKSAVEKIMNDEKLHLSKPSEKIKTAKHKKDWLPFFTDPLFSEFNELETYRNKIQDNSINEQEKD